jgi:hypothetical protein
MKAIFGILSLVIVLAIVGSLAKKQLQAIGGGASTARNAAAVTQSGAFAPPAGDRDGATLGIPGGMPGAIAADPNGPTVAQQARSMQERARVNTERALQQGMQRNKQADP